VALFVVLLLMLWAFLVVFLIRHALNTVVVIIR